MANVKKANRVQDVDIKRLNHLGLGLKTIAQLLGCHAATITLRLEAMGIDPTDTRRSFMESVYLSLSKDQQDWLSHNLFNNEISIKDFIVTLIKEAYAQAPATSVAPTPVAMPVMQGGACPAPVAMPVPATEDSQAIEEAPEAVPEPVIQVEPEYVADTVNGTVPEAQEAVPEKPQSLFESAKA